VNNLPDTVLIVDDSLTVRMDLQEAFENAGFRTVACATAAAAREALTDAAAHVVVLDVLLPDGDGVELLKEIRASVATSSSVVLLLSTEAEVKDRVRGLRTGADEYVGKPYDARYVVGKARELLRAKRTGAVAGRSTVLIIDDSVTFRESLRQALEEAGHAVLVAGSGEEGLRAAAAGRPSAIVVDSVLPGLDGATVIRRLRLDAALRGVPCLLLTGSEDRDAELHALDAGADAFVRKDEELPMILARLAAALRSAATSMPDKTTSLLGPKRILAVDDSATYLAEVAAMLRDEGYDVVPARSGEEALELLAVQTMDCILLDLLMPGLSGRETCQRIKAAPIVRDIPLIMLTALEDRGAMFDSLEAGADDYIQKSSEFEVLKARVRAQLRRKQFEDENRRIRVDLHNVELEAAEARAARALAAALRRSHDELELRVQERTIELTETTRKLEAEIAERAHMESVLRERDAALHRAHVMTKLAHVTTGPDGSFETWSDTLPTLIGVSQAQMPGSTREWLSLLHPEDRSTFRNTSIEAGVTGTRKDVEYRLRRADGTWINVSQVIEPIPGHTDADGRMRWFSTLQDVTEQKRVEDELRDSQQLLQAIIDNSAAVIYVKDLQGRYLLVNRRYSELFHISNEAIVGKSDHDLFGKDAADAFRQMDLRVAAADAPLIEEELVPHDDGPQTYVSVKCPLRDHQGRVCGVFGISTDITDRKLAHVRLQAQLDRMTLLDQITRAIGERQDLQSIYQVAVRSLEERLPVDFSCVCRFDPVDHALTVIRVGAHSQTLAMELAISERAAVPFDENALSQCVQGHLVYEADIATLASPFAQRLARGGLRSLVVAPLQSESRVFGALVAARLQPDAFSGGECEFLRQLSAHVALAAQQAELHGALQQAYDELRQSQQAAMQQERLRALGQMASGIAHDINNAISPVALYSEHLLERESGLTPRGRQALTTIARSIDDVAATVARMRDFYRQREGALPMIAMNLNGMVQEVVDLTRARWSDMPQQRGIAIQVRTDLAQNLPLALGVEGEIREALINLVFNAVDAMPEGGVLTLRTGGAAAGGAQLEVADTGSGMDEDTRRRCLEPFFTTKGERGTGLGLAMVYGTVQRHGGDIDIRSEPGRGTTFVLRFPLAKEKPSLVIDDRSTDVQTPRPMRILLVDDDPVVLMTVQAMLEADGHLVVAANAGQDGIDAFKAELRRGAHISVVLTDLGMPYVDGRKVARAVKELSPFTPVILLTGWGQGLNADADDPEHIDEVLSKPPKLRDLRQALLRHGGGDDVVRSIV
jgi:PAS domain S-box-containing protein